MLSRSLNWLYNHPDYHGFFMEMRIRQVNHLSFVDDTILFTSGRTKTLQLILQNLKDYEETSGQMINSDTSHFLVHMNVFNSTKDKIRRITGFKQKQGPITYLGCPLFMGKPRISHLFYLINKVICRITGWQKKHLSYGERVVLINHVLQDHPIHLISTITPPSTILKQIQMLKADFF